MDKQLQYEKGLGAKISVPDNRQIALARVQAPVKRPSSYRCDDNDIPTEDQGLLGTCMGEAEGGEVEYREKKDTGKVTPVSKLELYREAKAVDGYAGEGTYPAIMAPIKVNRGAVAKALVPDIRGLSHADTIKPVQLTQEMIDDAGLRVAAGYAAPALILEDILQAIYQNGTFPVTVMVGDWSSCPVKPTPARGAHRIRLNGYEELSNGDAKIYFRNSWGKSWAPGVDEYGNGYFLWSDYKLNIYEPLVYTDVPEKLILEARATPYQFVRTLKYKMTGTDVKELQKRLNKEIAFDGLPCYNYKENGQLYFSTYFGLQTQLALQRYQFTKGIVKSGTPETTGYGQLGPSTRKALNGKPDQVDPGLYPKVAKLRDQLKTIMAAVGHPIIVTDEFRSYAEQDALYEQGRTKPGAIVTNAKGGESMHNFRTAFDIAFTTSSGITYDGPWEMTARIAEALGLSWGGWSTKGSNDGEEVAGWPGFIDKPHFEFTAGYTLQDFQNGGIDEGRFNV